MSEIAAFLRALVEHAEDEDGNMTLVSFGEGLPPKVWSWAPSQTERVGEDTAIDWNNEPGRNVYWSAGLRRRDLSPGQRGGKDDLTAMLAIVVDLDAEDVAAAWVERAKSAPVPLEPSAVIRTSFTPTPRYQLVYLLREPCKDIEAWTKAARRLEAWFHADHCSKDPAHVWRLPGTTNYPNAKKRAAGRIEEQAVLLHWKPETRFDITDFDELPEPKIEDVAIDRGPVDLSATTRAWETSGEILGCLPPWLQKKILCDEIHPAGRSTFDWQIAKECARAGLNLADYVALYHMEPNWEFASKWREKEQLRPGTGDAYLAHTFQRARIEAEREGPLPDPDVHDDLPPGVEPGEVGDPVDWGDWVFSWLDFKDQEEEEVDYFIYPWLQHEAIHCVHGPTGAGKSYFVAHQLYGLAVGVSVGPFHVPAKKRVLYIDGEMGLRTIRNRTRQLVRAYGPDEDRNYLLWSPYAAPKGTDISLNILDPEHQQRIVLMAQRHKADVIVIDNVRTCTKGLIENDADAWEELNSFWSRLRALGLTVVWVHHDNKAKEDGTYAGSTNAMTVTEVQVPIKPMSAARVKEVAEQIENFTRDQNGQPEFTVTHGITVNLEDGKNREKDLSIHKKQELIYVRRIYDGLNKMRALAPEDAADAAFATLDVKSQAWALRSGVANNGAGLSLRDVARWLKISHTSVDRYVKEIENDEAAKARVKATLAGKFVF